ncbi:MAG: TrmH family RNA methyltransferase, partial [Candidatus Thiodiazotropha taylori]|nr:TrmH family RNA methyltransferase [Candidatus Thiodiazotropha taylori]
EVHLIDIGPFDPSPGKGAFKKVPAKFYDNFEQSYQDLVERDYRIVALSGDCERLSTETALHRRTAFVLGHEEWGHSFELSDYPEISCLAIPQFGQIESLNVAVAASIMMYEYIRQHPSR